LAIDEQVAVVLKISQDKVAPAVGTLRLGGDLPELLRYSPWPEVKERLIAIDLVDLKSCFSRIAGEQLDFCRFGHGGD